MNKNNIILIGMMGAGKSTIGKKLQQELSEYAFIDVDEYIEKKSGMKIPEIFEKFSEQEFRKRETEAIIELCNENNQIVATGGGAFENITNRKVLLSSGTIFYLFAPPEVLYDRIKIDGNRPMLFCENPQKIFNDLFTKRDKNYRKADFIIDTTNLTVEDSVKEILRRGYANGDNSRNT